MGSRPPSSICCSAEIAHEICMRAGGLTLRCFALAIDSLSLSLSRPLSLFFLHLFSSSGWELGTPGAAASLAELAEHPLSKREIVGSNPTGGFLTMVVSLGKSPPTHPPAQRLSALKHKMLIPVPTCILALSKLRLS